MGLSWRSAAPPPRYRLSVRPPPMPISPMRAPTGTLPTQGQGVPSFPASQPVGGDLPLTPPPPFNAPMPNTTTAFNPAPLPPPWQEVVQRIYLAQAVHLAQELTYPTIPLVEQVTLPPFSERKKLPHLGAS
ncbi:MAG UNVERIFIED_CONTAM: hypothetical protein LVT10_15670 [Anaerolineae bacterium]|jgi:hypothetical protein